MAHENVMFEVQLWILGGIYNKSSNPFVEIDGNLAYLKHVQLSANFSLSLKL